MFAKRIAEVVVLGLLLVAITAPVTKQVWSQAAPIRGEVSAGVYENIKSDGSGRVLTVNNSTYTFSSVSTTNAATTQLLPANTARKALVIQNTSTAYNLYVGTTSPVSATSGLTLVPGASFFVTSNVPTNTWYALGTSSVQTTQVGEGQ